MEDVVAVAKKSRKNKKQLAIEKLIDIIVMAEVAKVSSVIDLGSQYSWTINNADIDVARDLGLTGIKKYWSCAGQIQAKVDWLYKDWISALEVFVKHSRKTYDNEKVTENLMIRREINSEWASTLFVQLYKCIHYQKMDGKDIVDATKLIKKLL